MITNGKPRRIKILGFHKSDACFGDSSYIGRTGMFTPKAQWVPGYFSGSITYDDESGCATNFFFAVRYVRV